MPFSFRFRLTKTALFCDIDSLVFAGKQSGKSLMRDNEIMPSNIAACHNLIRHAQVIFVTLMYGTPSAFCQDQLFLARYFAPPHLQDQYRS